MTRETADIAIIGAGPYGLSLAAQLRSRGHAVRSFGDTMSLWRTRMPKGMRLKSEGFASNLYDPDGTFTLGRYCAENSLPYADVDLPVPLDVFTRYGMAFQHRFVPNVENRIVTELRRCESGFALRFADEGSLEVRRVVVAVGVAPFAYLPDVLAGLPSALVSHSSEHHALEKFSGRDVAVVGAGASAVDVAALLHAAGGNAMLVARRPRLAFHEAPINPHGRRPLTQRVRWPRSGIGNGWKSYLCAGLPHAFRHLPESVRLQVVRTHLGPAPCWFTKGEIVGKVDMLLGRSIERATLEGDRVRLHLRDADGRKDELVVDHVIAGTGYRPDLRRLAFVPEALRQDIALIGDAPALSGNFESSVAGLYFVGPIAANSFGPLSRFAFGARFAAQRVLRHFPPQPAKIPRLVMAAAD
jgi:cation diffusion facilitator CzcD-associated flavoprotein CzcO